AQPRFDHHGTAGSRAFRRAQSIRERVATARLQSDFFPGCRRLLGALEQLDRMTRHNRRYGVLVDELRVAVPTQQHAKIIEPGNDSLQLDAVHQEDRKRRLALADVIEEGVLQILCAIGCHCRDPLLARESLSREQLLSFASPPAGTRRPTLAVPLDGTSGWRASPSSRSALKPRRSGAFRVFVEVPP